MAPSLILNRRPQVPAEETAAFGPIAERFRRAGDLERAVSLCREGLQRFPQHMSARVTLGWALLDLGKYAEAQAELELVLRRAPDNLAAIRGLAELHDRSEHTMHLPMDGPGQWPPDEAAVNHAATPNEEQAKAETQDDAPVAMISAPVEFALVDVSEPEAPFVESGPAVFTAAAYESAVWTPASEPEVEVTAEPVAVVEEAAVAPADEPAAVTEDEADETVVLEPAVALEAAPAPVEERMVPEEAWLDPTLATATIEADLQPDEEAVETPMVSEADIAALIAEAERLEVEAESAVAAAALELDADAELGSLDELGLELAPSAAALPEVQMPAAAVPEAVAPAVREHVAEVFLLARVVKPEPARSPVAALELLLLKVQARRAQLMAQSVA